MAQRGFDGDEELLDPQAAEDLTKHAWHGRRVERTVRGAGIPMLDLDAQRDGEGI